MRRLAVVSVIVLVAGNAFALDRRDAIVAGAQSSAGGAGEYVSHSTWTSRDAFDAWTNSESVRRGHAQGSLMGILAGPPVIGLYEAVLEQDARA